MLENGTLVDGKYEILSKVGQGGMSVVYLALNRKAMKQWAIKEVRRDGVKDFEVVKQSLVAETDMLKKLSHPNLPDIVDIIETEDSFLIVMDYIEGNPLSKRLKESGAQPEADVIEWAKQLCDVLDYLHTRTPAIIYRDMKPSNVMLKPDDSVCLIDFGTAREYKGTNIQDTTCLGTIGYAAPEQFGGQGETDARTDIYCLGATLYHLVTGHSPAEPPYEMKPIRTWDESLSPGLEAIILKCTQRNPNDRYQSCAELKYALENIEENTQGFWIAQRKKLNRFFASVIAAVLFLAVGLTGTVLNSTSVKSQYTAYITKADEEVGNEAINDFQAAFEQNYMGDSPEQLSNYFVKYINAFVENDETQTVTNNELKTFKSSLGTADSSNTSKYINVIQRDANAYVKLNYEVGVVLLQHGEGSEIAQYTAAKSWLIKAYTDSDGKEISRDSLNDEIAKSDYDIAKALDGMISGWLQINNANRGDDVIGDTIDYSKIYKTIDDAVNSVLKQSMDNGIRLKVFEVLANFLVDDELVGYFASNGGNKDDALGKWNEVYAEISGMDGLRPSQSKLKENILEKDRIIRDNLTA